MSQVGRLFLESLRFDRETPDALWRRADGALALGVGGFIIFGGTADEVARFGERLQVEAGRELWIAADLERGPGQQFTGAATLPPPAALAHHADAEEAVRLAGALTGRGARELGVNWALAPVLDLDVEADNPIVSTRSFGADPGRVARLGRIWIDACQAEGVAACAKHFPGHGRSVTDSHIGLPVVTASRRELLEDAAPFGAVADTVAAMMTAHVAYPALDVHGPATLDPAVVRDLLRGRLGFGGLVVTDALIMGGIESVEGTEAERALRAGCDLLLYPPDLAAAVRAVAAAAAGDEELHRRVGESVARSDAIRAPFSRRDPDPSPARVGSGVVLELATGCIVGDTESARRALDRARPLEVRTVSDDQRPPALPPLGAELIAELTRLGWRAAEAGPPEQRLVLLEATPQGWKGRAGLSRSALEAVQTELATARSAGAGAYLVVLGPARLLDTLPGPAACAWGAEPVMERAAARWLDQAVG